MPRLGYKLIPVAISLALLAGAAADMLRRPKPGDAEPYHRHVHELAMRIPMRIGDWVGKDYEVARSAVKLLKPYFILQRQYTRSRPGVADQQVNLLMVLCNDARDMVGHHPLNCYPAQGWNLISQHRGQQWVVRDSRTGKDITLEGSEYQFAIEHGSFDEHRWVAHLIMFPGRRPTSDIGQLNAAEADRARRFYGAAQIQLVFDESFTDESDRRKVFAEIIGDKHILDTIDALCNGGSK